VSAGKPRALEVPPDDGWSRRENVRRNSAWNVASYVATSLTLVGTVGISVRHLSREEFGLFTLLVTLTALLPVLDLGLRSPVTVAAARSESKGEDYAAARRQFGAGRDAYRMLALFSALPWSIAALVVVAVDADFTDTTSMELAATIVMSGAAATGIVYSASATALATARGAYHLMGVCSIAGQLLNLVLVVLLVDSLGLVALGAGQLCNIVVSRGIVVVWVGRTTGWLSSRWRLPVRAEITVLGRVAGPALLLSLSAQFVAITDAVLLSALAGTAAVAAYRLGSVVPTQSLALLYRAVDVVFPLMAATQDRQQQERFALRATDWGVVLAGTGFGVLVVLRDDAILLLTGTEDEQLALLLVLFCAVWACNVPMHAWGLLLLARNEQRLLAPLVLVEAAVNFVLTAALIPSLGVFGAAIGTLLAIFLSNLVLQPLRLRVAFSPLFTRSIYRRAIPLLALSAVLPLGATWLSFDLMGRLLVGSSLLLAQPAVFAVWQRRKAR
jgi:O-antigen/teichoic acid export membrane protein